MKWVRWNCSLQTTKQLLLADPIDNCIRRLTVLPEHGLLPSGSELWSSVGLWLIHFNETLHGMDEIFFEVFWRNCLLRHLTKRQNRIFVVFGIDSDRRARRYHSGAMRSEQNQLETIRNFINAILNGDARHSYLANFRKREFRSYPFLHLIASEA